MHHSRALRILTMLAVAAAALTACSDDDDVTTSAPATTTTGAEAGYQASECLYDQYHFLTPPAATIPADAEVRYAITPITGPAARYGPGQAVDPADVGVSLWHIGSGDVLEAIAVLRGQGIDARPLYGFGFEGHWSLAPGGDPPALVELSGVDDDLQLAVQEAIRSEWADPTFAVVDAGFIEAPEDQEALETLMAEDPTSIHGTFVVTLIKLILPQSSVATHPAYLVDQEHPFSGPPLVDDDQALAFADDLSVADAIRRAGQPDYLNLSLGTYPCWIEGDVLYPLATETELAKVPEGTVIVAAGGNDRLEEGEWLGTMSEAYLPRFYPASDERVLAVGAANPEGRPIQWTHGWSDGEADAHHGAGPDERVESFAPWWNVTAPGIDLVSGPFVLFDGLGYAVNWSGSSFAAPVVAAVLAAGCIDTPLAELLQAHVESNTDPIIGYHQVPGLLWWDGSQIGWDLLPGSACPEGSE